jgi:hypothetical protein
MLMFMLSLVLVAAVSPIGALVVSAAVRFAAATAGHRR